VPVDQVHCTASAANRSMQVCVSSSVWNSGESHFFVVPSLTLYIYPHAICCSLSPSHPPYHSLLISLSMPSLFLRLSLPLSIYLSISLSPTLSPPFSFSLSISLSLLTGKAQPENPVKMVRSRFSALVYKVTKSSINLYNVMCSDEYANMKFIDHTYRHSILEKKDVEEDEIDGCCMRCEYQTSITDYLLLSIHYTYMLFFKGIQFFTLFFFCIFHLRYYYYYYHYHLNDGQFF
jgi:hypothetical protein